MSDDFSFKISIPTDEGGFILLKCPLCGELFKVDSDVFYNDNFLGIYCPACGLMSEDYLNDDVIELAERIATNKVNQYVNDKIHEICNKYSNGLVRLRFKSDDDDECELPIMNTVQILKGNRYLCCNMIAKIKPILKMSSSYCPYCGVKCNED